MAIARVPKKKVTVHDQKRHGQHHKATSHYGKTYWPYLPMLLIVGLGFFLNTTWATGKAVLGYATNVAPTTLLQETNIQRSQNGQGALSLNSKLSAAAQSKANDMIARDYWSHVTPDGVQPWQFISNAGYTYTYAGENLAYGFDSSAAALAGWMNSPGHKANILNTNYTEVGFGIANGTNYQSNGEQTVIVAMYGRPQAEVTPQSVQNGNASVTARVESQKSTPSAPPTAPAAAPATPEPAAPIEATPEPTKVIEEPVAEAPTGNEVGATSRSLQARDVSRIDVLTNGNAAWAGMVVAVLAAVCIIIFVYKHAKIWKQWAVRGEQFIIHHPMLDILFVFVGVLGYLLTRTTGFIH